MIDGAEVQPPWVRDWALAKVLEVGVYAESLYRFMTPERPKPASKTVKKRAR